MKKNGMRRFVNRILVLLAAVLLTAVSPSGEVRAEEKQKTSDESKKIENDVFWKDTAGNYLYSQGGGIFKFGDTYYWYGVKYKNAPNYVNDPTKYYTSGDTYSDFESITCYSSKDLVNWEFEGDVVTEADVSNREEMEGVKASWVGRLGVAKVGDHYVMLVQHECADPDDSLDALPGYSEPSGQNGWSKQVLVLASDSPTGEFKWNQRINMLPYTGGTTNTGDQTVFMDEDTGKSYLVYSYGVGRGKIFLAEIEEQEDGKFGLSLEKNYMVYSGAGREGDCMFKYNGAYYICASDLYGWNASHAYYLKLDSLEDEYLKNRTVSTSMPLMPGCSDDYCHVTQTGFFYTVKGSKQDTVIFCGDRWAEFAGNGLGFNQWCPLSFDESGTPYFNSLSSWYLDAETGVWSVAEDNNYVKNGSFDADRVGVNTLTGWTNNITEGNAPIGNSKNTTTGKYGLALTDTVDFACSVSQVIESSPYVELPDGVYELSAKVKNSGDFGNLQLYAKVNGLQMGTAVSETNSEWTTITLPGISVSGGKAEVGIMAEGKANAVCYIDDITFVKTGDAPAEAGTISGTIQSDVEGKTLTITAVQKDGTGRYTYETDIKKGVQDFVLKPVNSGTYALSASSYGCVVEAEGADKVVVVSGQTAEGVQFSVKGNTGSVKGKVVDENGRALSDVTVILSQGTVEKEVITDQNGEYEFVEVEAGEYELTFEKTGFASVESVKVTVVNGQVTTPDTQEMNLSMGTVTGTVYDAAGNPAAGATVLLRGCNAVDDTTRITVQADENGKYTFDNVIAGSYALSASQGKWDSSVNAIAQNIEVLRGKTKTVNLDLPETVEIINGGFEEGNTNGWNSKGTSGKASNDTKHGHVYAGKYGYTVWKGSEFTVKLEQTLTNLENGSYVVHMTAAGGSYGAGDEFYLYAKNAEGEIIAKENVPVTVNGGWELVGLTAEVTDGTLTFGVEGNMPKNAWANMDDFRVGRVKEPHPAVETDKTELETKLEQDIADSIKDVKNQEEYTDASWEVYQKALLAAQALQGSNDLTEEALNAAIAELQKAAAGLEKAVENPDPDEPETPDNPDKPDKPETPDNPDNKPGVNQGSGNNGNSNGNADATMNPASGTKAVKTGDTARFALWAAIAVAAIIVGAGAGLRRRKM